MNFFKDLAEFFLEFYDKFGLAKSIIILLIFVILSVFIHLFIKLIEAIFGVRTKIHEEIRDLKRKRYEDFIDAIDDLLAHAEETDIPKRKEFIGKLNNIYAKLYIIAPKHVIKLLIDNLNKHFDASSRNRIYMAFRKDLVGRIGFGREVIKYYTDKKKFRK